MKAEYTVPYFLRFPFMFIKRVKNILKMTISRLKWVQMSQKLAIDCIYKWFGWIWKNENIGNKMALYRAILGQILKILRILHQKND